MTAATSHASADVDRGSFRDPDSRVVRRDGAVYRVLSERGRTDWRALRASELFQRRSANGTLVGTRELDASELSAFDMELPTGAVAAVLEHDPVPFVSYPSEWSFSMLKDAALLHLELIAEALDEGLSVKDATPYNVQWNGARPTFIDVGSFEVAKPGEPWLAYRDFCKMFLNPLLLHAWKSWPIDQLLKGSISGISPQQCASALSFRDRFRRGTFGHVFMHARLERQKAGNARADDIRKQMRSAGFNTELIKSNLRGLARLIGRLETPDAASTWSEYGPTTSYEDDDAGRKEAFLKAAMESLRPAMTWDLGCNYGHYTRIAARHSDYVVGMDSDALVIERLYRELRDQPDGPDAVRNLLPLTVDLLDPTPARGWANAERTTLLERGSPDVVIAFAVIHHLSIAGGVPLDRIASWLRSFDATVVVEFVDREDPMARKLLDARPEPASPDYTLDRFETALAEHFTIQRREVLGTGQRILYQAVPLH